MATYGDGLSDVDLRAPCGVPQAARQAGDGHDRQADLPVRRAAARRVGLRRGFDEKPSSTAGSTLGFFVFEPRVFDYFAATRHARSSRSRCRSWPGRPAGGLPASEGFFYAMDTYREFKDLNGLWDGGDAPWKVWP